MKPALIICPFFTNGDWPPLGLSCVNGALRQAGYVPLCFDLNYQTLQEFPGELNLYRNLVNMGHAQDRVVFVLRPEMVLSFLYKDEHPEIKWGVPSEEQPMAASLYLGLKSAVARQAKIILEHRPDVLFFSTYISNFLWSMMLAKELKKRSPETPVVFGGPGVGLAEVQGFVLSAGWVDALIAGEGETTVVEIMKGLESNDFKNVEGVASLSQGEVNLRPRKPATLSELPSPSFTGLPLPGLQVSDYANNRPNPFHTPFFTGLPIYSSRGCVNRCAYCSESAYWKTFRFRGPESVFRDMARFAKDHGEDHFLFGDSAVNFKREWLLQFAELVRNSGTNPVICAYMFATPELDEDMARELFEAGFKYITLGIETFSGGIRDRVNKRYQGDELFSSICALTRAGIHVKSNLLVGFPGETEEDVEASLFYIRRRRDMDASERGPGALYWDAGHPLRLEAYSDLYNRPADYDIEIFDGPIFELPDALSRLLPFVRPFFRRWSTPARSELENRCSKMQALVKGARD